jgi:enolase
MRFNSTAGVSVGKHEVQFVYDGGPRWGGKGVQKAVANVNNVIAPVLKGMDATKQREVDEAMITLDGTPNKSRLGGNATASVSAAVLKAGAVSIGMPLYQYVGGIASCMLPVPAVGCLIGSTRYGGDLRRSGGKPSYSLVCYGFKSFSEASYACWDVSEHFLRLISDRTKIRQYQRRFRFVEVLEGVVEHDRELWDAMVDAIAEAGYRWNLL